MKLKKYEEVLIQSYKHNGSLHRTWIKGYVLDVTEEVIIAVTNKAIVVEANGRRWMTREPAIYFLYYKKWFNIIGMIRKDGVHYYCNIASPSLYDGEAIKNIDYDLDLKVSPNLQYAILDEDEYKVHAKQMDYGEELEKIIYHSLNQLIGIVENKEKPFQEKYVLQLYEEYLKMKNIKTKDT